MYIIITIGTWPFHNVEREVTDLPRSQGVSVGRVKRGVPTPTSEKNQSTHTFYV